MTRTNDTSILLALTATITLAAGTGLARADTNPSFHSHGLTLARHASQGPIAMTNFDADARLAAASSLLQATHHHAAAGGSGVVLDVGCCVQLVRTGVVTNLAAPLDGPQYNNVTNETDLSALLASGAANIKVVSTAMNVCGAAGVILGCADTPGTSLVLVGSTVTGLNDVWAHEFGHNQGLAHRDDPFAIMHATAPGTDAVNAEECAAFHDGTGFSGGYGSPTVIGACSPPAPTNETCATAIEILAGTSTFGTLTGSVDEDVAGCYDGGDVWYKFVAPRTGLFKVNTCGTNDGQGLDGGIDTELSVHCGCPDCPAIAALPFPDYWYTTACNDDHHSPDSGMSFVTDEDACVSEDDGVPHDSALSVQVAAGQPVYVRVSPNLFGGNTTGPFVLNVKEFVPNTIVFNDDCAGVIFASPGDNAFDLSTATTDYPQPSCGIRDDVWFRYSPFVTGDHTFSTCGLATANTIIAVYETCFCPVTAEDEIGCEDDNCGIHTEITVSMTAGTCYLLRLGSNVDQAGGGYGVLRITEPVDTPCDGDANGDDMVNVDDIVTIVLNWGCTGPSCEGDVNGDMVVNVDDIVETVLNWGRGCD